LIPFLLPCANGLTNGRKFRTVSGNSIPGTHTGHMPDTDRQTLANTGNSIPLHEMKKRGMK
jgi:hypothetical protein